MLVERKIKMKTEHIPRTLSIYLYYKFKILFYQIDIHVWPLMTNLAIIVLI